MELRVVQIKDFWLKIEQFPTYKSIPIALKILLVTAQRRGELAAAEWSHVDLQDKKLWTIPASNSKNGKEHRVPLSQIAIKLFEQLKRLAGKSRFVMPSPQTIKPAATPSVPSENPVETSSPPDSDKHITERAITKAVERHVTKIGMTHWTPHDLRRTASTQLAKLGVLPHIKEKILNHALPEMMAVYDQHDYMDERRAALQQLADKILKLPKTDDAVLEKMDREGISNVAASCHGHRGASPLSHHKWMQRFVDESLMRHPWKTKFRGKHMATASASDPSVDWDRSRSCRYPGFFRLYHG